MDMGYSPLAMGVLFAVGLPLAIVRPYWAFLLVNFLLAGRNTLAFIYTRTEMLGAFFNLNDACFVVAALAVVNDLHQRSVRIRVPNVVFMILVVLGIGVFQSLLQFGMSYDTLRAIRWALTLPVLFFLAANVITDARRANLLIRALVCGALFAAVQHLLYVETVQRMRGNEIVSINQLRTIAFLGAPGGWFLLAGVAWKLPKGGWKKAGYLTAGGLFLSSILLHQSRSIWVSMIAAIGFIPILFPQRAGLPQLAARWIALVLVAVAGMLIVSWIVPFAVPTLVKSRFTSLLEEDPEKAGTATRIRGAKIELQYWLDGTLILGRGLSFAQALPTGTARKRIAYQHVGYVAYLSQLGLIGLAVYAFFLPWSVVRDARKLWFYDPVSANRYLGLLAASCMIALSLCFFMSASLLLESFPIAGTLFGATWALARPLQGPFPNRVLVLRPCDARSNEPFPVRVVPHGYVGR